MKKRVLIITVIVLGFLIIGGSTILLVNNKSNKTEQSTSSAETPTQNVGQSTLIKQPDENDSSSYVDSFNLSDFKDKSEYFYHGRNIGKIDNAKIAIEKEFSMIRLRPLKVLSIRVLPRGYS